MFVRVFCYYCLELVRLCYYYFYVSIAPHRRECLVILFVSFKSYIYICG